MNEPGDARILVVEDQWLIAETIADDLRSGGFSVIGPALSLTEARELMDAHTIDAALLDIDMQGEKSFPLADALIERQVPFIFMSGYGKADLPEHLGDAPLLPKPASPSALRQMLTEVVASRA